MVHEAVETINSVDERSVFDAVRASLQHDVEKNPGPKKSKTSRKMKAKPVLTKTPVILTKDEALFVEMCINPFGNGLSRGLHSFGSVAYPRANPETGLAPIHLVLHRKLDGTCSPYNCWFNWTGMNLTGSDWDAQSELVMLYGNTYAWKTTSPTCVQHYAEGNSVFQSLTVNDNMKTRSYIRVVSSGLKVNLQVSGDTTAGQFSGGEYQFPLSDFDDPNYDYRGDFDDFTTLMPIQQTGDLGITVRSAHCDFDDWKDDHIDEVRTDDCRKLCVFYSGPTANRYSVESVQHVFIWPDVASNPITRCPVTYFPNESYMRALIEAAPKGAKGHSFSGILGSVNQAASNFLDGANKVLDYSKQAQRMLSAWGI